MEITIQHLFILVIVLFFIQYILTSKEKFEQDNMEYIKAKIIQDKEMKKDKECGQKSVNYGFLHYVFNSPKTPAR